MVYKLYTAIEDFAIHLTPDTLTPAVWKAMQADETKIHLVQGMSFDAIRESWARQGLPGEMLCFPCGLTKDKRPVILVRVIQPEEYEPGTPNYALLKQQGAPVEAKNIGPMKRLSRPSAVDWGAIAVGETKIVKASSKANVYRSMKYYKNRNMCFDEKFQVRELSKGEFAVTRVDTDAHMESLAESTKYAKQKVFKEARLPIPASLLTEAQKRKQDAAAALKRQAIAEIEGKIIHGVFSEEDTQRYRDAPDDFIDLYIKFYLTPVVS